MKNNKNSELYREKFKPNDHCTCIILFHCFAIILF